MPDAGETQITSGRDDRLPVSARLLVVSFVLLVAVIGVANRGERQAGRHAEFAFGTQQRELVMRLAHQIKGAGGQVGAARVAEIARVIGSDGKDGAMASAAVAPIDGTLTETSAALEAYFSQASENA